MTASTTTSTTCILLERETPPQQQMVDVVIDPFQGVHRRFLCATTAENNASEVDEVRTSHTSNINIDKDLQQLRNQHQSSNDVLPISSLEDDRILGSNTQPHLPLCESSPISSQRYDGNKRFRVMLLLNNVCAHVATGASTSCRQFVYGFVLRCCTGIVLEIILVGTIRVLDVISPGAGSTVRLVIVSSLQCIGCLATTTRQVIVAPIMLLALVPIAFLQTYICGPSCWIVKWIEDAVYMVCMNHETRRRHGRLQTSTALIQLLAKPSTSWLVKAIFEEVTFRCILNWPLWLSRRFMASWNLLLRRQENERTTTTTTLYGYSPWILVKGLCFGAMHMENCLLLSSSGNNDKDATTTLLNVQFGTISGAIHQSLWCFLASVRIFDPLANRYGLAAAIGAHATHNALRFVLKTALRIIRIMMAADDQK